MFHRPHPQKETDRGAVASMLRFLVEAGIGVEGNERSPGDQIGIVGRAQVGLDLGGREGEVHAARPPASVDRRRQAPVIRRLRHRSGGGINHLPVDVFLLDVGQQEGQRTDVRIVEARGRPVIVDRAEVTRRQFFV